MTDPVAARALAAVSATGATLVEGLATAFPSASSEALDQG